MYKIILCFAALAISPLSAQKTARAWPHETSDLKPDPAITWGKLTNGMRYVIMPNGEPPQRVSMRLYVATGSLMEEETQQGLAHFLEHMAFNGTKNFKAEEIKGYFERLGMSFGGDTNAHTSFAETVYDMELPESSDELLKDGFRVFRDYADGMLLDVKELDKERGVILSEKLARDTVGYRMLVEGFNFSLPESLIPKRLPIGQESVIKSAARERFTSFYSKWYTPDRLAVIVVGKVDPADIAKRVESAFGDMKPATPIPDPDFGKVSSKHGLVAKLLSEKEAGDLTISIDVARASRRRADNAATRQENLVQALADAMLNRRYERLIRSEKPPFNSAEASSEDFLNFVEGNGIRLECEPDKWETALAAAEQELRRAIEHGFTAQEFAEAKANLVTAMENGAKEAPSRRSRDLASEIQSALAENRVFTHPADDVTRVKSALPSITPELCHASLKKAWNTEDIRIFAAGNLTLENGAEKIKQAFLKSRKTKVDPPAEAKESAFAYTNFGTPGKVKEQKDLAETGITLVTFENNVRLTLKPTDFKKNSVVVSVNFGNGRLGLPKDKPGLMLFAGATFDAGGLEKHTGDELEGILAGKEVGVSFSVGDAFCNLAGATTRDDLQTQLQLLCAQLTAPGYREDGMRQLRMGINAIYNQVETTPEGIMKAKAEPYLRSDDYRFQFGEKEEMKARTMADVKAWLEPQLKQSYLEIAIVGDFDLQTAVQQVAGTFGALPKRADRSPYEAERVVKMASPGEKLFSFASSIPKAIVAVHWPTTDRMSDIKLSRQLNIVASVLEDRVNTKVREDLGESYSPNVGSMMSDSFKGDGTLVAMLIANQANAGKIAKLVKELAADLAQNGATEDEVNRAKQPILKMLQEQMRKNEWWMKSVLSEAQSSPNRLEWPKTMLPDYEAVSKADVDRLAKLYLQPEKAIVLRIEPPAAAAPTEKPAEKATKKAPAGKP